MNPAIDMVLQKSDLQKQFYQWRDAEINNFRGDPSRKAFDPNNGYRVLFLINYLGSQLPDFSVAIGQQIENLLVTKLPMERKSEISVLQWVSNNLTSL